MIDNQHFDSSTILSTQPRETRTLTEAMKARQKQRVTGPTTDCCSNQEPCIEEKQRVREQAVRYTQKNKKKGTNIYAHTRQYACWYVFVYEEWERIRVQQPAVRYTQQNKQTNTHNCVSVSVCVWGARANHCHTGAHRDTKKHAHTLKTQANTCQVMIDNQHFHSSTVSQYSATRNTHTHWSDESPEKTPDGRADNWLLTKISSLYRGKTGS